MASQAARRRRPAAAVVVLLALLATGLVYAFIDTSTSAQAATTGQNEVEAGRALFAEGCSSCHGLAGQGSSDGPTLIGVGAAAVSFQVGTGRMPLAQPGAQAVRKPPQYDQEQIAQLAAYVATLGPGPAIPTAEDLDISNVELSLGAELFRVNCQQCHSASGQGGALSDGGYAPNLGKATPQEIYEAMLTGPSNMPVFGNGIITPDEKRAVIKYVQSLQAGETPGGIGLGNLGPVTEGLFIWTAGLGALLAAAIWIGVKAR